MICAERTKINLTKYVRSAHILRMMIDGSTRRDHPAFAESGERAGSRQACRRDLTTTNMEISDDAAKHRIICSESR
jgi:hypothetical protein